MGKRQSELLSRGRKAVEKKTVPTLKEFAPCYLDEGARANRQKPSGECQRSCRVKHVTQLRSSSVLLG
ncbi:hypothetical protein [Corallococcus sp. AB049A]|uniref:hypothetical protein n=1 Tax=Corallococcus sp. AB049A TaxID=2316721 RepID=UPI001F198619|nr:hypothetical protein [Corallococcus sp. AB049A]